MAIAIAAAIAAVYVGVTLAAVEQPQENGPARPERLSRVAVVVASVTAASGAAYGIGNWLFT